MRRTFLKSVGRYAAGQTHDWPIATWQQVARSAKMALDKLSSPTDAVAHTAVTKGGKA